MSISIPSSKLQAESAWENAEVMKAINTNQAKALKKAVSIAPRSKRAMELLSHVQRSGKELVVESCFCYGDTPCLLRNITVGTQSISPFYWAIESGSLECARAMIQDLLTIRADRDLAKVSVPL